MNLPDIVNGCFELFGGALSILNVRTILRDKQVRGMALTPLAFITAWGYWNVFYYPHLDQWFSFAGGLMIVAVNSLWLGLAVYYTRRERRLRASQTSPYLAKCKRLRLDGPTPCLCCEGDCHG